MGIHILRTRYSHEGMIDLILATPGISQKDIAREIGYTESWVSMVINSDAFQEKLAERKGELIDPMIQASMDDRLRAVAGKSLENVLHQLCARPDDQELALEAAKVATKAMGFGAKAPSFQQNNFVVQLPPREPDSARWADRYTPSPAPSLVVDNGG